MPAVLVALLVVVPLVELYVLIQVGQVIGALPTIALLVVVSLLGAALLRREGPRTWRAFQAATQSGRVPAREVADGALVMLAGALLLTPGFVSDVTGLALLLPPVRALVRARVTAYAAGRLLPGLVPGGRTRGSRGWGAGRRSRGRTGGSSRIVEGEVLDPRERG